MTKSGVFTALALAISSVAASAQESSRPSPAAAGMEIVEVVERFAKRSGKKVIIDPRVRAIVEVEGIDPGQPTWEQLLAILDVHQFVAVDQGGLVIVVPDANSRQLPTPVYTDLGFKADEHEVVTLLLEVRNTCAPHIVPVLRPLMPQAAHLAAYPQANSLILTDRAANVRRIAKLVEGLDQRGSGKKDCTVVGSSVTPLPATSAKPAA